MHISASLRSFTLFLLASGCSTAHWDRTDPTPREPLPVQEYQVWSHGSAQYWISVHFGEDSISGIPVEKGFDCEHCRLRLSQSEVDSVFIRNERSDRTLILVIFIPVMIVGLIVMKT